MTAAAQSRVNQTESSPLILNNQVNYNQNNANFISKTNKIKIFISNLPCHLKQTEYEDILTDKLKNNMQLKWAECEAVYSKYGAAVIWYNDRETASKAYELLKNSNHENNSLKCLYLPSIQVKIYSIFLQRFKSFLCGLSKKKSKKLYLPMFAHF
jgi:hypothetical protein